MTRQEPPQTYGVRGRSGLPPAQRRRRPRIRWLASRFAAGLLTAAVFLAVAWALLSLLMALAN